MKNYAELLKSFDQQTTTRQEKPKDEVILISAQDLKPEPISWLWPNWIAEGKLHLLAGQPGQGKTTIAISFCATVSAGCTWPDGSPCTAGNVLIWSGEDDVSDTLLPRLIAAGCESFRCHFIKGVRRSGEVQSFDPARDMLALEQEIDRIGDVKLLVLDPIVSVVTGDSHSNTEVRRALQSLVDLANRKNFAVLGITHFSKGSAGVDPMLRVIGSVAFVGVARSVFVAQKTRDTDGGSQGVFAKAKANSAISSGGFAYSIEQVQIVDHIETSRIAWGEELEGSANELLSEVTEAHQEGRSNELQEMLRAELENGPKSAGEVIQSLQANGYSTNQIKRASISIAVKKDKQGMHGGWTWSLPSMPITGIG